MTNVLHNTVDREIVVVENFLIHVSIYESQYTNFAHITSNIDDQLYTNTYTNFRDRHVRYINRPVVPV